MKIHVLKKVKWCAVFLALLMIGAGCASKPQKPETPAPESRGPASAPSSPATAPKTSSPTAPPQKESYYTHTVKWSGETISIIAAWYTGDLENWKILAKSISQANPDANINRIYEGNKVLIPESLMKTWVPMPKEFVDSYYPKSKPVKEPSKTTPSTEEEEPKLFGPRETPRK